MEVSEVSDVSFLFYSPPIRAQEKECKTTDFTDFTDQRAYDRARMPPDHIVARVFNISATCRKRSAVASEASA